MDQAVRNPDLHAAVLAAPDDDVPRLVYADWLMERGDPRGELIALQVERATLHAVNPRAAVLMGREKALMRTHLEAWQRRLPQPCSFAFERGFVERLECTPDVLTRATLEDTCVRELHVTHGADLARIASLFAEMAIRVFAVSGEVHAHDLARIRSPHLAGLRALRLLAGAPTAGHARAIQASSLGGATDLEIENADADVLAAVAKGPPLRRLVMNNGRLAITHAHLRGTGLGSAECLHFRGVQLREDEVRAIVESAPPTLVELDLSYNWLNAACTARIAREPRFATLRRLGLACMRLNRGSLAALVDSPYLSRRLELVIDGDALGMRRDEYYDRWHFPIPEPYASRFRVTVDESAFTRR